MGFEKKFKCSCPECGKEKNSRKRDVGKLCSSCNMKKIEKEHRHLKVKENKPTTAEHNQNNREKYKDTFTYRLHKIINQAKARAKNKKLDFDLTLDYILDIYPEDNLCPVFKTWMVFNSNGAGGFRETSPSIDRLDSSKGYTKDNVAIISTKANILKSNATLDDITALYNFMKIA
jgi:hypothetical protein